MKLGHTWVCGCTHVEMYTVFTQIYRRNHITGRQIRRRERKEGSPWLRWLDDFELDWQEEYGCEKMEKKKLWTQQNGHLSQGKPRPHLKSSSAKEEEEKKNLLHSLQFSEKYVSTVCFNFLFDFASNSSGDELRMTYLWFFRCCCIKNVNLSFETHKNVGHVRIFMPWIY